MSKRRFVTLSAIAFAACAVYTIIPLLDISLESKTLQYSYQQQSPGHEKTSKKPSSYLVDTPGCKIPKTKITLDNMKLLKMKNITSFDYCKQQPSISRLDASKQIVQLKKGYIGKNCTLTEIQSDENVVGLFSLLPPVPFNSSAISVGSQETMFTSCDKLTTFYYNFPITPQVRAKIKHWKGQKDVPVSVLFLGIDTTSRSHFLRSTPQATKMLHELNFVDFQGYHSHQIKTLDAMLALPLGMSFEQVKEQKGNKPMEDMELLWRRFSASKYVTMYIEDESSSLATWKYLTFPFRKRPTDYFPQPLFTYMSAVMRERGILGWSKCVSWEPKAPVVLKYTRRFVEKFQRTPFFAFTWFTYPFHDVSEYLRDFDRQLASFFEWLKSSPGFLRRTLIVLLSDHGIRETSFAQYTYEGFLERSLPFLFMRIPELLTEKYKDIQEAVNINSKRLSTAYDIHHTLLHLLKLTNLPLGFSQDFTFSASSENRSSLFLPLPLNRTCKSADISEQFCVCNASISATQITNPYFLQQLYTFGIKELNDYIHNSPYRDLCQRFSKLFEAPLVARVVRSTAEFDLIVFRFTGSSGDAQFEITVKVNHETRKMERIGTFNRVNRYGDQSWCVSRKSGMDKGGIMNHICVCKQSIDKKFRNKR